MKASAKAKMKRIFLFALAACVTAAGFSDSSASLVTRADDSSELSSEAAANEQAIGGVEDDLAELEKKQEELDKKLEATKGDINAEEERQSAIREQILTIEETLHKLAESITELETEIVAAEMDIAAKEAEVELKKAEIVEGVDSFKKRLRIMYIAGGDSYTDILVGASDFYDMLMKLELVKRVANHDNDAIDALVSMKEQFEAEQEELNLQKQKLEESLTELQSRRKKQQSQKEKLEALYGESEISLEKLASDKEIYEQNLEELEHEHEQFEADLMKLFEERQAIQQAEEETRRQEEEARREEEKSSSQTDSSSSSQEQEQGQSDSSSSQTDSPSSSQDQSQSDSSSSEAPPAPSVNGTNPNAAYGYVDKSRFTWPVPGYYHISYGVGWRWGAYHKGIDIWSDGIRGHNIIASDAGEVILVSNTCTHDYGKNYSCGCGGGYGNYCIIDHGGGWWTLYGHSERITVSQGQYVDKYAVLGTVGSTGHSTGPHLHFEVRQNGVALDPQGYV